VAETEVAVDRLQPVRLPKMAELIAGALRRQIVRGELKEGDALPSESELLARFSVSRPTLREAFRVLESESLITVRRGAHGGARVQLPNIDVAARYAGLILEHRATSLADVYQARIIIEPPAVGLLAARRTDDDIARLREALEDEEAVKGGDLRRAVRAHVRFHSLLIELAGNQTLVVLTGMIEQIIERAELGKSEPKVGTPEREVASRRGLSAHHRVVDLIEAGGQAGAEELWRKHLTEARDYLLSDDLSTVLDLMG
jgi:DNA-binding FadR family transcriptional regulator